jgi:hypothetical protein
LDKTAGVGFKVDTTTPTYPWHDLLGRISIRGTGAIDPSFNIYRGGLRQFQFTVNDEVFNEFHIPHDYLPGSDLFIHAHWSHAATTVTSGGVTWSFEVTSAKGHNQQAFAAPVTQPVTQAASTIQYQHRIAEVQISSGTPTGTQLNNNTIEPDSLIIVRCFLSANTINGTPEPFLHQIDLHYQSTDIGTKQRAPNFYV